MRLQAQHSSQEPLAQNTPPCRKWVRLVEIPLRIQPCPRKGLVLRGRGIPAPTGLSAALRPSNPIGDLASRLNQPCLSAAPNPTSNCQRTTLTEPILSKIDNRGKHIPLPVLSLVGVVCNRDRSRLKSEPHARLIMKNEPTHFLKLSESGGLPRRLYPPRWRMQSQICSSFIRRSSNVSICSTG